MKIAIIGAGFAGLASAYFLLESGKASVTIFEADRVGAGASGVCGGLLHPYPGFAARRSSRAMDALAVAKQLIRVAESHTPKRVASHHGIIRKSMNDEQKRRLIDHCGQWGDIERVEDNLFAIHSGITVHSENYLEGLKNAVIKMGAELLIQKIASLEELKGFDQIVIAAGFGIREFPECQHLNVKFLKGQALRMKGSSPMGKSFISRGYIAHLSEEEFFDLGSTYEREFLDDKPNLEKTKELLAEKLSYCKEAQVMECRAGVRVASRNHYLPIMEKVAPKIYVFTALGSRGLLYHGLYGRDLACSILLV